MSTTTDAMNILVETNNPTSIQDLIKNLSLIKQSLNYLNEIKINFKHIDYRILINIDHNNSDDDGNDDGESLKSEEEHQAFKNIHLYKEYYSEILSNVNDYYKYEFNVVIPHHIRELPLVFNNQQQEELIHPTKIKFHRNQEGKIEKQQENSCEILPECQIEKCQEFNLIFNSCQNYYKKFNVVCLGGTFDRLHLGHKILLTQALLLYNEKSTCELKHEIQIGISVDNLLKNKKLKELIQSYELRRDNVLKSISKINPTIDMSQINIFPLPEPWGPIATDPKLEVLVVSEETLNGAKKGNEIRKSEKNFPTYEIVCIPLLLPRSTEMKNDESVKLSSSQLRELDNTTTTL